MHPPDVAQLGLTGRIARLSDAYRHAFEAQFDPQAFRSDNFYAAQVLEKAIATGTPELRATAREIEGVLRRLMDSAGTDAASLGDLVEAKPASGGPASLPGAAGAINRRGAAGGGQVRLDANDIVLLSQMRIQYRRLYGHFFDLVEFAGNDLYARTLLTLCLKSGDERLAGLARKFLNGDGTPRLHRREGAADLELAVQ